MKEWFSVTHTPKATSVKCSIQEGNLSVSWTVKAYASTIKTGVEEARKGARRAMSELKEAVGDAGADG